MSKQREGPGRGAKALMEYVHKALHAEAREPEEVAQDIAGVRVLIINRAVGLADARRMTAAATPAAERWRATHAFLAGVARQWTRRPTKKGVR